ncbi:hypothetical protein DFAR_2910005 [Desulfarculales bacterium]
MSGDLLKVFDRLSRRSLAAASRPAQSEKSFTSLSHLPKGAVALTRLPGRHLGETPLWRTDMDED